MRFLFISFPFVCPAQCARTFAGRFDYRERFTFSDYRASKGLAGRTGRKGDGERGFFRSSKGEIRGENSGRLFSKTSVFLTHAGSLGIRPRGSDRALPSRGDRALRPARLQSAGITFCDRFRATPPDSPIATPEIAK